jgi:hypothetical protein
MTNRPILALALTSLAIAGCGGDDESSNTPVAAAADPVSASAPYGTYTRTMTAADLKRTAAERPDYGPHQGPPPKGEYRLTIAKGADGDELRVTDPGGFTVTMHVEAEAGLLNLVDYVDLDAGTFCGPDVPIEGSYRAEPDGGTLALAPSPPDPCADRDSILTGDWKG